jgi:hypothetical protein
MQIGGEQLNSRESFWQPVTRHELAAAGLTPPPTRRGR